MSTSAPLSSRTDFRIETVLARHPRLRRLPVRYRMDSGTVTLSGRVDSWFEKQMLQEVVRGADGVVQIDNRLDVDWTDVAAG